MKFNKRTKKSQYRLIFLRLLIIFTCLFFSIAQNFAQVPQTNEEKLAAANQLANEAVTLYNQKTAEAYQQADEKLHVAARLFEQLSRKQNQAEALFLIGLIAGESGNTEKARQSFSTALEIFNSLEDSLLKIIALENLGMIYKSSGQVEKALAYYHQALPIFNKITSKEHESIILNSIGNIYNDLGEKEKALTYYEQNLPIVMALGNKQGETVTLSNIAGIYVVFGEKRKALNYYVEALAVARSITDQKQEALVLNYMGKVYHDLGEKEKALDFYGKSLILRRQVADYLGEVITLDNIGEAYNGLGNSRQALEYFNQALELSRRIGDQKGEGVTLDNIGTVYDYLGDKQKALDYYTRSLNFSRAVSNRLEEASTLNNIGGIYRDAGDWQKALTNCESARQIFHDFKDVQGEITALNNIALAYDQQGDELKAIEYFKTVLTLSRKSSDRLLEVVALINISASYISTAENEKALDFLNRSLPLAYYLGDKRDEAIALTWQMVYWKNLKQFRLAAFYGKQAIAIFQELRSKAVSFDKNTQRQYLKSIERVYRFLADVLLTDNRLTEAQQVLDLFKDEQFFDFNKGVNEDIKHLAQTTRESESALLYQISISRIGKLSTEIEELKASLGNYTEPPAITTQRQKLEEELKKSFDAFLAALKQIEIQFSKPADLKDIAPEIANTVELQKSLQALNRQTNQKTVVIYTLIGENDFRALIISADNIKQVSTSVKADELNKNAFQYWKLLQSDRYDPVIPAKQIYDVVFKPIEPEMPKDTTTIMWSLDGNLRYIPMAALFDGKNYLVERFNNVNFTRADPERMTRKATPNWTALGLGSSQAHTVELFDEQVSFNSLPGTIEELHKILKQPGKSQGIFAGELLEDAKFNKQLMIAALKQHRPLVHIASHFSFRPGDASRSFLLMGDGTAFTLEEMKSQLDLFEGVDLLTLSACNTAATQSDANGREVDGFAELAQRLGAGAVLASLWSVADESTALLMSDFYRIKKENLQLTKAEAIKRAQLLMLQGTTKANQTKSKRAELAGANNIQENFAPFVKDVKKPFAHPYYWSPFVLVGNWK